ncbi:MAG: alkyl hydroperoxide reductase subunit C [Defluviitaleaceae bacterium]|nr:alkyl hydroperoxide reductase subunit C [Defluviitaleaceae bacterium]
MSLIGKKVSEFTAQAYVNGDFKEVTLNDLKGKWSVFVFYPADFTFVCPTELGDLADKYAEFQKVGCEVYSVSTDTHFIHKAWHDTSETIRKIKYPMLADPNHKISEDFEVLIPDAGLALRGSFIINPDTEIVAYEVNALGIGRSAADLLRKVQAAQFVAQHGDQVCPANWTPGEETLKPGLDLIGKI